MEPPRLSQDEEDQLVEELADALEEMVDRSCSEMGALWVMGTRDMRAYLGSGATLALGFEPSARFLALSSSRRTKFRQLALWRHAVLWHRLLSELDGAEFADAMATIYFTPYPSDAPPYAWSSKASAAPGVERFPSPTSLKHMAKEACWETVARLRTLRRRLEAEGGWANELRALFLKAASRDTLRDVLKLEDHPNWER